MKTRRVLMLTVTLALLPAQALAAFCLTPSVGATFVLAISGGAEGFFTVTGVLNGPCTGPAATETALVTGTARLLPNQDAELGLLASPSPTCGASFYYARLFAAQGYQQGTGQVDNPSAGFFQPRTYVAVPCP
jgi:hypothetical protein